MFPGDIKCGSEVLTWGLNNNLTLGHADEASRAHPERVCALMGPASANVIQVMILDISIWQF